MTNGLAILYNFLFFIFTSVLSKQQLSHTKSYCGEGNGTPLQGVLEPTPFITKEEQHIPLYMAGQEVFKTAVTCSVSDLMAVLTESGLNKDNITYYILHQANFRILDYIRHRFGVDGSKLPMNVDKYGNTSSASIPMLLDELNREGKLRKGDLLAFSAFGAGFTSGACIIEWNK